MTEKKYCIKTETLAGFAKALGHPARIAIMIGILEKAFTKEVG